MTPFNRTALDPTELSLLQMVYHDVCRELQITADDKLEAQAAIAKALLEAAATGERNPQVLKTHVLLAAAKFP